MKDVTMFNFSRNAVGLEFTFSATLENIDKAAAETIDFLTTAGKENISCSITLIMREALINAVVHGCGSDERKTVKCDIKLENDLVILEVEDDGAGFKWEGFLEKEPSSNEDLGRGLAIIKKYCTDVRYNTESNKLIMRKMIT